MVFVNVNRMSAFATDKPFFFFLSRGRCGNSEPGKFSLPVNLSAHTFEMFILELYAQLSQLEGLLWLYNLFRPHFSRQTHLISVDYDSKSRQQTWVWCGILTKVFDVKFACFLASCCDWLTTEICRYFSLGFAHRDHTPLLVYPQQVPKRCPLMPVVVWCNIS